MNLWKVRKNRKSKITWKKTIFWKADYKSKILLIFCTYCKSVFCAFIDLHPVSPQYMGGCFTSARIPEQPKIVQCDTFHSHLLIFIPFPFKNYIPYKPSIIETYRKLRFVISNPQCFEVYTSHRNLPKIHFWWIKPSMFQCLQVEISEHRKTYSIFRKMVFTT